jgi:uncharacterized protein (TIGR03067 family)
MTNSAEGETMARIVAVVLMSCVALGTLAGDRNPQPEDASKRFFRCWLCVEEVEGGKKTTDPERLYGQCFAPNDWSSWGRRGELAAGPGARKTRIIVDTTTNPMRFTIVVDVQQGKGPPDVRVTPGIFKFDGDRLVTASSPSFPDRPLKPAEDYPERPKDFTSGKGSRVTVSVHQPCAVYDQD